MRAVAVIAFALATAITAAAQPSVEVTVPKQVIRVDQPFQIHIKVSATNISQLEMPVVENVVINPEPISQRTSRSARFNGTSATSSSSSVEIVLGARAETAGQHTIDAFVVHHAGGVTQSEPIVIDVIAADAPAPTPAPPKDRANEDEQMRADEWDEFVWLTSEVDKRAAYVGEAITLTLTKWEIQANRLRILPAGPTAFRAPSTNGFFKVDADQREERAEYRNFPYRKDIFTHVLYPTMPGNLTIGEWQWQGRGMHLQNTFFRSRARDSNSHSYFLETPAIPIHVKALPPAPSAFSGAVGEFELRATVEPPAVVVGQPARLTVTISGKGNPEIIGAPIMSELENAFVSGPEAHVLTLASNDPTRVDKAFVWQIVPKRAENIAILPVDFTYFDPAAEEYTTLKTASVDLGVVSAPEGLERVMADDGVSGADTSTSVDLYSDSLAPIVRDPGGVYAENPRTGTFVLALATPAIAYIVFAGLLLHRRRLNSDTPEARANLAFSRGKKRLAALEGHSEDIDGLHQALRGYIADRLGVPEGGVTSHDAEALLASAGVDAALSDATVKTLRACERAAYASQALSPEEHKALLNSAVTNMERLERTIKGGPRT